VQSLGTVTPMATVTIYSQITGVVNSVHYREGQMVRKGDPLVDIDPRPYQATLNQALGTLKRDQAVLEQARMDLTRYQTAAARNAIPRQQAEDQQKIVMQDEGTVQTDQATVDYDKVQLSYCHIVAPITGRVGLRLVDPGNTVFSGSSSTLAVITQLDPITVVFNVSEDDLPQVQAQLKGKNKTLQVDAFDRSNTKLIETGKLTSLDNQIDTTTGTLKFRATFANKKGDLFPNQFVNARLLVTTLKDVVLVPTVAVQHNGTASFVYIVNDNKTVRVQNVQTPANNDTVTAVTGLAAGTNVATSGFDRLENGTHVQVKSATPKGAAGGSGSTGSTGTTGTGTGAP
jgi:multidrug efflux system membrane fusion protein